MKSGFDRVCMIGIRLALALVDCIAVCLATSRPIRYNRIGHIPDRILKTYYAGDMNRSPPELELAASFFSFALFWRGISPKFLKPPIHLPELRKEMREQI